MSKLPKRGTLARAQNAAETGSDRAAILVCTPRAQRVTTSSPWMLSRALQNTCPPGLGLSVGCMLWQLQKAEADTDTETEVEAE